MKTKENLETKTLSLENKTLKSKPKSLRPMRSLMAVRSLKPKTHVAQIVLKSDEVIKAD